MQKCCDISNIISQYYNQVRAYLIRRTGDPVLAEDLTQDTMMKLVDAYNNNTDLTNPRAWLFQIARNKLTDKYRSKRIGFIEDLDWLPEISTDGNYEESPSDLIHEMIKRLPEKYGQPLHLSDIEGKSLNEVAISLNLSLSATKMRVQRGRTMLLEMYRECCNIEYTKTGEFCDCILKDKWIGVFDMA